MIYLCRNRIFLRVMEKLSIKDLIPDKIYLTLKFKRDYGYYINWGCPKTFIEKLQWLKLNYRKSIMTILVDKYEVKDYVSKIIGDKYIIPTLGVWNSFDEIDFSSLPNQFVLKCTHDSGGIIICKDKSTFDIQGAKKLINEKLNKNFYYLVREWPYKYVKHRIIAERYMSDNENEDLIDYKFYCFNGIPKYCQLITNRSERESIDFFDEEWVHQDFIGLNPNCKNNPSWQNIKKPLNYREMIALSKKLAGDFPFSRIDFYNVNNNIYFGEITFFPAGGFGKIEPDFWNLRLGEMINLKR